MIQEVRGEDVAALHAGDGRARFLLHCCAADGAHVLTGRVRAVHQNNITKRLPTVAGSVDGVGIE